MTILEVERKFCSLAIERFSANTGFPPFRTLHYLGQQTIHDVYYDKENLLSSKGIWIRERNGSWEAKIKRGGDYRNSKFEELSGVANISRCLNALTAIDCNAEEQFGLDQLACFTSQRDTWLADKKFKIVQDVTDFGHTVGEVELQTNLRWGTRSNPDQFERECLLRMTRMDVEIASFMGKYWWAFIPGMPKGKLAAYLELGRGHQS